MVANGTEYENVETAIRRDETMAKYENCYSLQGKSEYLSAFARFSSFWASPCYTPLPKELTGSTDLDYIAWGCLGT